LSGCKNANSEDIHGQVRIASVVEKVKRIAEMARIHHQEERLFYLANNRCWSNSAFS